MERALAIEGKVAVDELRAAKLNDQTRAGVGGAAVRLRGLPLSLLPLAGEDFETVFERLDPLRQIGLVIVDYLQLVPPPKARTTQDEDTALVLRHLKALALARQVALLVVAQLPGFQTGRDAKRPTLDDYGVMGAARRRHPVDLPRGDVQPGRRRGRRDRVDRRQEPQRPHRIRGSLFLSTLDAVRRHARP
jgi:replicative DNA helicase